MLQYSVISGMHYAKRLLLFLCGCTVLLSPAVVNAQSTPTHVQIVSISENDGNVEIRIQSDAHFIIGDNRYMLYVGEKSFMRSTHPGGDETKITFFIPVQEYRMLHADEEVVLSYGAYEPGDKQRPGAQVFFLGKLKR